MLKKYQVFLPEAQGTVEGEWRQCLKKIKVEGLPGKRPVKLNVFIDVPDYESYQDITQIISNTLTDQFGDLCPAFNVTVHPPERPLKVAVEAAFIDTVSGSISGRTWHSIPYIIRETYSTKEIWAGGLGAGLFHDNSRKAAAAAFDQMRSLLEVENMSFDNIIRQWNFIGNILDVNNEVQNYQIFNEVRSEYYNKYRKIHSYPAATGVGMKYGGVSLDFCAVKAKGSLKIIAIDNPDQIRPYDYSQQVLKGKPAAGKGINQPPQFERALYLADNNGSTLFVSGTASIIGQETIGIDDIEKQTIVTLGNISKLTNAERIGHLAGKPGNFIVTPGLLRVYIKNKDDFGKVKSICHENFPDVPSVYIEADICRDNLLVEIEAEFTT